MRRIGGQNRPPYDPYAPPVDLEHGLIQRDPLEVVLDAIEDLQEHMLLQAAITLALQARGDRGTIVAFTSDAAFMLYENGTEAPAFVHVRANFPTGMTSTATLLIASSQTAALSPSTASSLIEQDEEQVYLVRPGQQLWGYCFDMTPVLSGTNAALIPVVQSSVVDTLNMLKPMMQVRKKVQR